MKYKRILLKLSGESLAGSKKTGIHPEILSKYAQQISKIADLGIEIGIVIGGGNIFRGLKGASKGYDRVKGDQMGMLATVINSIAISSAFNNAGTEAKVLTATPMNAFGEYFSKTKAINYLKQKKIVVFAGGTGNPFFTTDTAAALRAVEIEADVMIKGTRVDGIYSANPEKEKQATKFDTITYDEIIKKELRIMDLTATSLCRENKMPVIVFNMNKEGNLKKLLLGENIGTVVKI